MFMLGHRCVPTPNNVCSFIHCLMLGLEPEALLRLSKHFVTEPQSSPIQECLSWPPSQNSLCIFLHLLVCYTLMIPNLCSEKKRNHFLGMPWLAARKLIIPARNQSLLRLPHTHSVPPLNPDFVKPQKCQGAHSKTLLSPIPFSHLFHFAFSGISEIYILILFFLLSQVEGGSPGLCWVVVSHARLAQIASSSW